MIGVHADDCQLDQQLLLSPKRRAPMTGSMASPTGPVFISYRQSDGTPTAVALAWLFRAAGIPVWQDRTDLPPGDTESRLEQALAEGLSGAALVVTEDIDKSAVVRNVELPGLLALAHDPAFSLVVANTVRKAGPGAGTDYGAPDRLLAQPGKLSTSKQYPADTRAGLVELVGELLEARAVRVRQARTGAALLQISVQTRERPVSHPADGTDLSIRLRPALQGRLPDPEGLLDLRDALPLLPRAVSRAGAREVLISGGAHLSVAFALGAALPATLLSAMRVDDGEGGVWTCGPVSSTGPTALTRLESHAMAALKAPGARREVLAYVDLRPGRADAGFTRLLSEHQFDAHEQICPSAPGRLDPATSGLLIEETADRLRSLVERHDHARLHLLLRCPFPVAVLLGRLCNTLRVVVYEWDDTELSGDPDVRPRYVPTLQVQATQASGPITEVLLQSAPTTGTSP